LEGLFARRLARRDEALATIAELRKAFPNSRWLDDAKALEVEVRQASVSAAPRRERRRNQIYWRSTA